jgi:spore germination protein
MISYFPDWNIFIQALLTVAVPFGFSMIFSRNRMKEEENLHRTNHSPQQQFTGDFSKDLELVRQEIGHNTDVTFRVFRIGHTGIQAALVFVNGLVDLDFIHKQLIKSLMADFSQHAAFTSDRLSLEFLTNHVLTVGHFTAEKQLQDAVSMLWKGSSALLIDGSAEVLILGTRKVKSRNVGEPASESFVRGPRLGFNENISDNIALLRQHGENDSLSISTITVGQRVKKDLVIAYINDIANEDLVAEVRKRIEKINFDNLSDSGTVEQFIQDNDLSPFPQVQSTERPDGVIGGLLDGRVAILLDGSPFALVVPVTFSMFLQSPEDYYERWIPASLIRLLRFLAALISTFGPSIYISFISFHQALIPTKLAISIAGSREGVPFPSWIEAFIMEVAIEILREAGLRLPKPVGQAIGIVGGLVIGEAAVQAGIVSPIMVIVVAITAISSFAVPQYSMGLSLRMLRFAAMSSAAVFGMYGVVLIFLLLGSHVVRLKVFGVPYASPAASYLISDWKDFMVRVPPMLMKRRPKMMQTKNPVRKR